MKNLVLICKEPWNSTKSTQFIFVAATIPNPLLKKLDSMFPNFKHIQMPKVHQGVENVKHRFLTVNLDKQGSSNVIQKFVVICLKVPLFVVIDQKVLKVLEQLLKLLIQDSHENIKTMVFCNNLASCRSTGHFLESVGQKSSNFHGGIPPQVSFLRF